MLRKGLYNIYLVMGVIGMTILFGSIVVLSFVSNLIKGSHND